MAGSGLSVAVPNLMIEYRRPESSVVQLLTYSFLFLSIGNLFWVPLAAKFGKRAALLVSMALQAGALVWCATATSFSSLLAARCVQGFAGAAGESIVPELVADVFFLHQRAAMMSIYIILISGGSAFGPLISSLMVQYLPSTWRAFLWLCFALAVANIALICCVCPESNLQRPIQDTPERQTASRRCSSSMHPQRPKGAMRTPCTAPPREILAPIRVDRELNLFRATVMPLRLIVRPAVVWGILLYGALPYLPLLTANATASFTMSTLLQAPPYLFSAVSIGLMQLAALAGFILACYGGGILSDRIHTAINRRRAPGQVRAEDRLVSLLPGMALGPAGCILLGVAFRLVSFGSVFAPNIALAYLTHWHQREATQCLVLVNVVKNLVAFLFLYEAVVWVQGQGYLEVYLVMFALGVVTVAGALPLYLCGRRRVE
ncbi:putative MFS transporter [Aspergillus violaceofuscus CBS 115571]|uniref:Putative MFS transporter n=1 Tax=Aspergillus violaceofuscus (strain CBS 115571) TaxID=1450538 RepID=A0A2V5GZT6_ASPV1|nr:putative MFS transporter [Aspergillus violaceofuscus CBS 115571]